MHRASTVAVHPCRYVYWRLLSTDPEAAKDVVLAEKPVIADNSAALEPSLLQQLLADLSTLASVRSLLACHAAPCVRSAPEAWALRPRRTHTTA